MGISGVIIAKNEEHMIANCIETLRWCDEVVVIDHGSSDNTRILAERAGAKVHKLEEGSFVELRNKGLEVAKEDWILYIDADERVTPKLSQEILQNGARGAYPAYAIPRNNIHYGKWMQHGGWEKDSVIRLFRKEKLKRWVGEVHEHAEVDGEVEELEEPLVHLTHRNLVSGLYKSIEWTPVEAELLLKADHPKVTVLRLCKVMAGTFFGQYIGRRGYKDGIEGFIEAMVQTMNRFFVYEQLWELQRNPSLDKTYAHIEREVADLWKKEKR